MSCQRAAARSTGHHQASEVIEREGVEKIPWKLQRLQGIRLALEGEEGCRRIAAIVRVTTATLNQWINWYREGGIEALLSRALGAKGGHAPRFTPQECDRFRKKLAGGTWRTARDAQRWLREAMGLKVSRKEVCRHLGKLGARRKAGRRSHVKKDPAATEAFKSRRARREAGRAGIAAAHGGARVGVR